MFVCFQGIVLEFQILANIVQESYNIYKGLQRKETQSFYVTVGGEATDEQIEDRNAMRSGLRVYNIHNNVEIDRLLAELVLAIDVQPTPVPDLVSIF